MPGNLAVRVTNLDEDKIADNFANLKASAAATADTPRLLHMRIALSIRTQILGRCHSRFRASFSPLPQGRDAAFSQP